MRTFIAIPLPDECRQLLSEMQISLRRFGADVRWTAIPSIHLTLKFLGEIQPEVLPALGESLRLSAIVPEFTIRIEGLGAFPDLKRPRVIWCGIEGDRDSLSVLQERVEAACARLDMPKEERAFHPHLTLGRVQGKRNLQPLTDYIRIASSPGCGFTVDRYQVYKSTLTPRGAIYDMLEAVRLPKR